jgi:hypothetical protein
LSITINFPSLSILILKKEKKGRGGNPHKSQLTKPKHEKAKAFPFPKGSVN